MYLSTMVTRLLILFLLFALIGCADQGLTPVTPIQSPPERHSSLVPGVVAVLFADGTTSTEAEQFLKGFNLTFKSPPSGSPPNGVVSVPIDTEDQWVERLKTYPIVKSAGRIAVTWIS
jgi:hypothetical protein